MEKLVVEITSKDMVRPCSPTPNHLKTLQLSFRDQLAPPVYMPYVFFYQSYGANYSETTKLLKETLSRTLVQFYPMAGRVEDLWIDCNDEGFAFNEANVLASAAEVIGNPNNPRELLRLLPFLPYDASSNSTVAAGIQVNRFSCGGVALAFSISHKIADGSTFVTFVNDWANTARGDSGNDNVDAPRNNFVGTSLFPQMNLSGISEPDDDICKEKIVSKRLIFTKETIDMLKKRSAGRVPGKAPTKVQVVSAFLWKQFIKAARANRTPTPTKIFGAAQAVNLRSVKAAAVPNNSHGNIFTCTLAYAPVDEDDIEYPEAVDKLRDAVKLTQTSQYYSEKLQTGKFVLETKKAYENISRLGGDYCFITDLTKFPLYQADFGWGTPIWVSMPALPFRNFAALISTKCGEGIEVWLNMLEHYALAFEQDYEFLALSPSNAPLNDYPF